MVHQQSRNALTPGPSRRLVAMPCNLTNTTALGLATQPVMSPCTGHVQTYLPYVRLHPRQPHARTTPYPIPPGDMASAGSGPHANRAARSSALMALRASLSLPITMEGLLEEGGQPGVRAGAGGNRGQSFQG